MRRFFYSILRHSLCHSPQLSWGLSVELLEEQEEKNKKQYKVIYLEEELKKSEQEKVDLAEAWKKELEEARRPW
jgi:hypothetical protein